MMLEGNWIVEKQKRNDVLAIESGLDHLTGIAKLKVKRNQIEEN